MNPQKARNPFLANFCALLCTLAFAGNVLGDEVQDVKSLLQEGKLVDALSQANMLLEKRPADPSLQFLKGLILSEQKKTSEAIDVFAKLTQEHPDFPEPYNNLAVLFALDGQYAKARIALETALKVNPKYTTAQENLGDVFLQSALQAYVEAAKTDGSSIGLRAKVRSVRGTLGMAPNGAAGAKPVAIGAKRTESAPAGAAGEVASTAGANPSDSRMERELVLKVVDQWVKAWARKDISAYFATYALDFRPAHGQTREQWQKNRRLRISKKDQIDIQVVSPSVTVEDKTAVVNFQQVYVAGKISSNARKSLTLKNDSGTWKIFQEKSDG